MLDASTALMDVVLARGDLAHISLTAGVVWLSWLGRKKDLRNDELTEKVIKIAESTVAGNGQNVAALATLEKEIIITRQVLGAVKNV